LLLEFSKGRDQSRAIMPQYQMVSKGPQLPEQVEKNILMETA
jgi:hypothetical protein